MKNFGDILTRKFSSQKPSSGSKLFAGSFGDLMRKTMPTETPSTTPPESSEKEPNSEWMRDEKTGLYFKYFWKDGVPKKIMKKPWWLKLPWLIA